MRKHYAYVFTICLAASIFGALDTQFAHADIIDSSGAGFTIPDNDAAGVSSTINLAAVETITDVQVNLTGLAHTWVGDLIAQITSPSGTTADLFFRVGPGTFGDGSNLNGNYTFADGGADFAGAAGSIGGGGTIPSATYQPATNGDGAISLATTFAGESTNGNWTLLISDNAQFDNGSLGGWGLNITSSVTAIPEPGPLMLVVLTGIVMTKRRRRKSAKPRKAG